MRRARCAARRPRASWFRTSAVALAPGPPPAAARSSFLKRVRLTEPVARRAAPGAPSALLHLPPMNSSRTHAVAAALLAAAAALILGSCTTRVLGIDRDDTVPGPGPNGKPMRTVTDEAVGLPPAANAPIYPLTARVAVNDNYFGTKVEDPYRWLENLDSPQVHQWVLSENGVSQPQLASLPQRPWLKNRLTQLWSYERYDLPVHRGAHYFYLHNDGAQNQSVLYVTERLDGPGRVLFDPNAARADATVSLSEFHPSEQGELVAYAVS